MSPQLRKGVHPSSIGVYRRPRPSATPPLEMVSCLGAASRPAVQTRQGLYKLGIMKFQYFSSIFQDTFVYYSRS